MIPSLFTPAKIIAIDDRPGGVRILSLRPERPFPHRAGQYLEVDAAGYEPRPYSIANAPAADGTLVLHVRDIGTGLGHHLAAEAAQGDIVAIDGPFGELNTDPVRGRPVLMVAGGTGVAPMLALAQEIIRNNLSESPVTLVFGVRTADDVYCRPELDALAATGDVILRLVVGPRTPDREIALLPSALAHHIVYVSGPDAMMHSVHKALLDHHADPARIFTDADIETTGQLPV